MKKKWIYLEISAESTDFVTLNFQVKMQTLYEN